MLVDRANLRRHTGWLAIVSLGTLVAAGWYLIESFYSSRWPGGSSRPGLVFGIVAAAIIFFELLLWPRKRLRAWRLGRAQSWLRAHIWLGLLSVPLVALHTGGGIGGQLSALLLVLFAIVIASGIWGLALQQFLPRMMLNLVSSETIYWEIERIATQNCYNAEELVLTICGPQGRPSYEPFRPAEHPVEMSHLTIGSYRVVGKTRGKVLQSQPTAQLTPNSEALRQAFYTRIGPFLMHGDRHRQSAFGNSRRSAEFFQDLKARLAPSVHSCVDEIADLCQQRRHFDRQAKLHHWLHGWLLVHAPLSVGLAVLLLMHIYVACKYW